MAGGIVSPTATISHVSCDFFRRGRASSRSVCHEPQSAFSTDLRCQFRACVPPQWRNSTSSPESRVCRTGLRLFISWHGRSHLGDQLWTVWHGRLWRSRRSIASRVHASLLGVGAPEFLVIAVVALVVFGPKGLAEVARTLGKSLKAFQPTIQELQQVSREFRNTLEQEIGLDEFRGNKVDSPQAYQQPPPAQEETRGQNGSPNPRAYTTEDYVKITEEQTKALVPEDLRREAEAITWGRPPKKIPADNSNTGDTIELKKPEDES